jgi:hypothetical protein
VPFLHFLSIKKVLDALLVQPLTKLQIQDFGSKLKTLEMGWSWSDI